MLRKKAFTLAEVLITLVIIGVISALTIPSLVQNIQEMQFKVAYKTEFSILNQASLQLAKDNGGHLGDLMENANNALTQYRKYINLSKICPWPTPEPGNCWASTYGDGVVNVIQSNGMMVAFDNTHKDCHTTGNMCVSFRIDVNGFKGPNECGKDIFLLFAKSNGVVVPAGMPGGYFYNLACEANSYKYLTQ